MISVGEPDHMEPYHQCNKKGRKRFKIRINRPNELERKWLIVQEFLPELTVINILIPLTMVYHGSYLLEDREITYNIIRIFQ